MSQISAATIEKYQEILRKDPRSKVFAALADAHRERGQFIEAEQVARQGLARHPEYSGGYVALGRLFCDLKKYEDALVFLKKASDLAPENLLVYELLGRAQVALGHPREALKALKMALFLNPQSEKSQKAVKKLETLSAAEFDEELFEMKPLSQSHWTEEKKPKKQAPQSESPSLAEMRKDRLISLIDALLIRSELERAEQLSRELFREFPHDPEVQKRHEMLAETDEEAVSLRPQLSREKALVHKQIRLLEEVLRGLDSRRNRETGQLLGLRPIED